VIVPPRELATRTKPDDDGLGNTAEPDIVRTRVGLRSVLTGVEPGFVPTMGALHDGHLALIRRSAAENARTVVSVFVNPGQFDDPNDLAAYPRDLKRDAALARSAGADFVFAPPVDEVYPPGFATAVEVTGLSERWEGAARPGHFRAVATVVARLLGLVRPARAYFGEKDYQQLLVIRRLHADLGLPGAIVGCPTVRDADGLPLSSRNGRLSGDDRRRAAAVPRALCRMANLVAAGETVASNLVEAGERVLLAEQGPRIDYLAVVDEATLAPTAFAVPGSRALIAVRIGDVRVIDNVALAAPEG